MGNRKNIKKKVSQKIKKIFSKPEKVESSKSQSNIYADYSDFESDIVNKISNFTMTSSERIISLIRATEYVIENNIDGSIVECGVWKGGSIMAILHTLNRAAKTKDVFLYDTFEGMSEPSGFDLSHKGDSALESYKNKNENWCYSSLEEVRQNISSINYPTDSIHFIKGNVLNTIPNSITPEKIALLRLDTDWYDSTKHEMEHLFPRLTKGGIIIIDDYGHWSGCKKAIDEYLIKNDIKLFLSRVDYTCRLGVKI